MPNPIIVKKKIKKFNKKILVNGDKSLSIRWVLFSSLASGTSEAKNLLLSEDVLAAIKVIKKLGIKVILKKNICKIYGKGIDGYNYKNNLKLNAENSGTLGRLILGLLINSPKTIILTGDKSLSKRDFKRVTEPLSKFGAKFTLNKNFSLPLSFKGTIDLRPIKYNESKGSAQCKSSIIFGGMRTEGKTVIKAKKSRNHTELMCKYLNLPIKVKNKKNYDLIKVNKVKKIKKLNYNISSDISWRKFAFRVSDYVTPSNNVQIKFIASDSIRLGQNLDGGSLIEAAVDDLYLYEAKPNSTEVVNLTNKNRNIIKITDLIGRELDPTNLTYNKIVIFIYDDGHVERQTIFN